MRSLRTQMNDLHQPGYSGMGATGGSGWICGTGGPSLDCRIMLDGSDSTGPLDCSGVSSGIGAAGAA